MYQSLQWGMWWQVSDEGNGATLGLGLAWAWDHPVMSLPWCGTILEHGTILRMGPAWHGAMLHGTTLQHPGAGTILGMGHPGCGTALGPP